MFNHPQGVEFVREMRALYVADSQNHVIRKVELDPQYVRTVAGVPGKLGYLDGAINSALFSRPTGVAVADGGNLIYVADLNNHCIRLVSLHYKFLKGGTYVESGYSKTVTTVAGIGRPGSNDGPLEKAALNEPWGIALSDDGKKEVYTMQVGCYNGPEDPASTRCFGALFGLALGPLRSGGGEDGEELYAVDHDVGRIKHVVLKMPEPASPPPQPPPKELAIGFIKCISCSSTQEPGGPLEFHTSEWPISFRASFSSAVHSFRAEHIRVSGGDMIGTISASNPTIPKDFYFE
eukprot:gene8691-10313_t